MRTKLSPMDRPAKPLGAFSLVEPWITSRKMNVRSVSAMNADVTENPPGEAESYPFCPKPLVARLNVGFPRATQ